MMIILIDRLLQGGKGRLLFLASGLAKIMVISGVFFLVARISETAVFCFILGISVIALAATAQGIALLFRSLFHGT